MSPREIITHYCRRNLVSEAEILGLSRKKHWTDHRQAIAIILRDRGMSFSQIGAVMNRDHSSILHLVNKRGRK